VNMMLPKTCRDNGKDKDLWGIEHHAPEVYSFCSRKLVPGVETTVDMGNSFGRNTYFSKVAGLYFQHVFPVPFFTRKAIRSNDRELQTTDFVTPRRFQLADPPAKPSIRRAASASGLFQTFVLWWGPYSKDLGQSVPCWTYEYRRLKHTAPCPAL